MRTHRLQSQDFSSLTTTYDIIIRDMCIRAIHYACNSRSQALNKNELGELLGGGSDQEIEITYDVFFTSCLRVFPLSCISLKLYHSYTISLHSTAFTSLLDLSKKTLVQALRLYLSTFMLPGEAQKISRLMGTILIATLRLSLPPAFDLPTKRFSLQNSFDRIPGSCRTQMLPLCSHFR